MQTLATVFLWLMIYSFIGWAYESTLCSITGHKLVNRGFLNGPICPVYGFGALIIIFALGSEADSSVLTLFFTSAVLTCTLEYITSWLLEKLFHAKWWDYSKYRFNINGRVSLLGGLVFGLLGVLVLKVVHPFVRGIVDSLPLFWLYVISATLFCILVADVIVTVKSILTLNHKLEEIQAAINLEKEKSRQRFADFREQIQERAGDLRESLQERANDVKDTLQERGVDLEELRDSLQARKDRVLERFENSEFNTVKIKALLSQRKFTERRLLDAFPKLQSLKHNDALESVRAKLKKRKK